MVCRLQSAEPMLTCTEQSIMVSVTVIIISIILWLCPEPGRKSQVFPNLPCSS